MDLSLSSSPLLSPLPICTPVFPLMLMLDTAALVLDIWRVMKGECGKHRVPDVIPEHVNSSSTHVLHIQGCD